MKHFRSPQKYLRNIRLVDFTSVTEIAHLISGGSLNRFTEVNMYKKKIQFSTLILLAALAVTTLSATDQEEINLSSLAGESGNVMQRDKLRNQLMSAEERSSFRSQTQSTSNHQEREEIRT